MFLKLYANSGSRPETQLSWQEELGLDDRWSWRQCAEEPMPSRPLSLHVHFLLSLILLFSSSSLTPNLSPQQAHSGLQNPVMHQPPFSSCLLCGLIDGRTLTSCPPSISPTYPALEGPLSPPLLYSSSTPTLPFHRCVHYSLSFPLDPERAIA